MSDNNLIIDFASNASNYRRKHGGGTGQPIVRAIGLKTYGLPLHVVDATAGLGTDAFVLASCGCNVTLIERSPQIAALLQDALQRGQESPEISTIIAKMQLIIGDSLAILATLPKPPDVVYLDPMFPERNKTALVKKEMRILKEIVGSDPDCDKLLEIAQRVATRRVVVKRPKGAPYLNNSTPHSQQIGQANRFDIYMPIR